MRISDWSSDVCSPISMHAEVGAYASERGIDVLLAFGPASAHAAQAFGAGARTFDSMDELNRHLPSLIPAHILVKGSRSTRMERVVRAFEEYLINHEEEIGKASCRERVCQYV